VYGRSRELKNLVQHISTLNYLASSLDRCWERIWEWIDCCCPRERQCFCRSSHESLTRTNSRSSRSQYEVESIVLLSSSSSLLS